MPDEADDEKTKKQVVRMRINGEVTTVDGSVVAASNRIRDIRRSVGIVKNVIQNHAKKVRLR